MDVYALLPAFWHGMTPDEKKLADSIFKSHENTFSVRDPGRRACGQMLVLFASASSRPVTCSIVI